MGYISNHCDTMDRSILEQKSIGGHPDPQDIPFHEPGLWAPTLPSLEPPAGHDLTTPFQILSISNQPHLTRLQNHQKTLYH